MALVQATSRVFHGAKPLGAMYVGAHKAWEPVPSAPPGPPVTAGLTVWLDAADVGTITTQWPDKSGQGNHGTIVGPSAPVVRTNALNGLPVVRFSVSQGRVRGHSPVTNELTLVYLARMVGPVPGRIFTVTYPPNNCLVGWHISGGDGCYDDGWVRNPPWPAGNLPSPWRMYGFDMTLTPLRHQQFYVDGVMLGEQFNMGQGFGGTYHLSGYDAVGDNETCDCEVAEMVIYNRKLSDTERQQVENYLQAKWRFNLDPDTAAYVAATGLDPTLHKPLDDLVVGLKAKGLWSKMVAIYPFIGGTAALHKWNLKDPRDLDAAYRLTFTGGTHSTALGYRANEQNQQKGGGQADTHLVPLGTMNQDSLHLAWYSTLDVPPNDRAEMGCFNWSSAQSRMHIIVRYEPTQCYYSMCEDGFANVDMASSTGLFVSTRTTPSGQSLYRNGAIVATSPGASIGLPDRPVWVGGINYFANRTDIPCGFASIGAGLTAQNNADLYALVQAFQTALGRAV